MPDISVIIATRNRALLLEDCLVSLCEQTLDPARYDICVVDNGSTDHTLDIVDKISLLYPRHTLKYLYEEQAGVCRARNRALNVTQSTFVAITDDDVRVPKAWLEDFLTRFSEGGAELAIDRATVEALRVQPRLQVADGRSTRP